MLLNNEYKYIDINDFVERERIEEEFNKIQLPWHLKSFLGMAFTLRERHNKAFQAAKPARTLICKLNVRGGGFRRLNFSL